MPGYCEPWPGNMNTTGDASSRVRPRRAARPGAEHGRGRGRDRRRSTSDAAPMRNARRPDVQRVGDVGQVLLRVPVEVLAQPSASRSSSAAALRAERVSSCRGCAPVGGRRRRRAPPRATACAFVPPTPNELTAGPARRAVACPRLAAASSRRTGWPRSRWRGWATRSARVGGMAPCSSASTVLIRPATPGRARQVADVRLHRADAAEPAAVGVLRGTPRSAPPPRSGRRGSCRCRAPRRSRRSRA